jgi:predicted RNA-binding Zn ribbon-like protein
VSALRLSAVHAAWAQLAAALVNTRPRPTSPAEKLPGLAELQRLLAGCPEDPPQAAEPDVTRMRDLRAALLEAFEADTEDAFALAVNRVLARTARGWELAPAADGGWTLGPVTEQDLAAWFGARAARGLAELTIAYGIDRLHLCWADDCGCAVVDVSRNGTRRYCSRTCANRTNVRRHRRPR